MAVPERWFDATCVQLRSGLEEAERGGISLAVLSSIARVMDEWLARGRGHDNWTVVAENALRRGELRH
jgi:hypothetical protein